MKIICEKGYHAGNVLRLVAEYLEKRYPDDMIRGRGQNLGPTKVWEVHNVFI